MNRTPAFFDTTQALANVQVVASDFWVEGKTMQREEDSLNQYLNASILVKTLRSGEEASPDVPLTLFQARRFFYEELMAWGERTHGGGVLDQLAEALNHSNDSFLDQLIPAQRGVITMAFVRCPEDTPWDAQMEEFPDDGYPNLFLLVRNGQNVRAIFSHEPSHEAAKALFPCTNEAGLPFDGIDTSALVLDETWWTDCEIDSADAQLLYTRTLCLLHCLNRLHGAFGIFHPRDLDTCMLDLAFQRKYLKHVIEEHALGEVGPTHESPAVLDWIAECNKHIRKGARVVVSELDDIREILNEYPYIHFLERVNFTYRKLPEVVHATDGYHHRDIQKSALTFTDKQNVYWFNGPHAERRHPAAFLCLEKVKLDELRHHLRCRKGRSTDLAVLKLLRDAEHELMRDLDNELGVRDYLRKSSFCKHDIGSCNVENAITEAIADWRAFNMGADTARAHDPNSIAVLLLNPGRRDGEESDVRSSAKAHAAKIGALPLMVTATDDNEFALYAAATDHDIKRHGVPGGESFGVHWRWVMRYRISRGAHSNWIISKGKPVWLLDHPMCAERTLEQWPELQAFLNRAPEPVDRLLWRRLSKQLQASTQMQSRTVG